MPICYTKRRLKDRFNEHRRSFDKPNVESKPAIVAKQFLPANPNHDVQPGAGENTLRRLALFVYLDHPTKNDVTSGKKVS